MWKRRVAMVFVSFCGINFWFRIDMLSLICIHFTSLFFLFFFFYLSCYRKTWITLWRYHLTIRPVCSDAITNQWKKRLNVHWKKKRHINDVICPLYIESLLIFLFKIYIKANKFTLIFKFKIQELHQYSNVFSEIRIT